MTLKRLKINLGTKSLYYYLQSVIRFKYSGVCSVRYLYVILEFMNTALKNYLQNFTRCSKFVETEKLIQKCSSFTNLGCMRMLCALSFRNRELFFRQLSKLRKKLKPRTD